MGRLLVVLQRRSSHLSGPLPTCTVRLLALCHTTLQDSRYVVYLLHVKKAVCMPIAVRLFQSATAPHCSPPLWLKYSTESTRFHTLPLPPPFQGSDRF